MGATKILPTISTLICSLITLILTFLKSSGVLVGLRDSFSGKNERLPLQK